MKRVLLPIGILVVSVAVAVTLIRNTTRVKEAAPEIVPISVRVAYVPTATIRVDEEYTGNVAAARQANIAATV